MVLSCSVLEISRRKYLYFITQSLESIADFNNTLIPVALKQGTNTPAE